MKWFREVSFASKILRLSLEHLIGLYEYLALLLAKITKEVVSLARSNKNSKRVQLIESIPGIGTFDSDRNIRELQYVKRFKSSDKPAAYRGQTPLESL